ncbi:MAG: Succinoglycan biosynthesis protein [Candidatus Gottesmanbacteria bacterium GW2011_GWC2_39_8]|uniref:Succinoglycan biosynthesis protein n=1 Tax=Candidatus Gottesmanbacteria bacterium GW2011_GWC2_39_8 TaxID=1618450 RepID=A0A0G0PWT7_9BACT|nr:MAG: Succinoglycan biosynthesis protein [Candidatus Gottesmanbacteria bacterium GW2011_GWC2_39_8]
MGFLIVSILFSISLLFNFIQFFSKNREPLTSVSRVVDGDTIIINPGNARVRLSNIEAPELDKCGGPEAKKRLTELVERKNVHLEALSDDVFNRSIVLVYSGDKLINETLAGEGLVRYDGSPSPGRDAIKSAYQTAVTSEKGIYGPPCRALKPDKPGCFIKGNIERNTGAKRYFFPGCSKYNEVIVEKDLGESWFCTEKEAEKANYIKSGNCFGKKYK